MAGVLRLGLNLLGVLALLASVGIGFTSLLVDRRGETVSYRGGGWFRESVQWDAQGQRFLLSRFEGGISQLNPGDAKEQVVVSGKEWSNTLGIQLDPSRNRLLAVITDALGKKQSALAAFDLNTWKPLFVTKLEPSSGKQLLADDVAVDAAGNAYVTDAIGNSIWKLSATGELLATIVSPVFTSKPNRLPFSFAGLNGIVYHPDGFLLVVHTWSGALFKLSLDGSSVSVVDAPLLVGGDGIELLLGNSSSSKLVVSGVPGARLLESSDGWKSAVKVGTSVLPFQWLPTAVTVKDGKPFVNFGLGWSGRFMLREAVF